MVSPLFLGHLPPAKTVPVISARGIIAPVTYWSFTCFSRVGERVGKWWNNKQFALFASQNNPNK
jgi:hypothetical protein